MEAAQKVALEPLPSALAEGLFYIMLLWLRRTIMPHYVKKLGEKKFAHGVLICFLKEFAVAGGRSGMSCEAYVLLHQ
jgi:hypothetical protein